MKKTPFYVILCLAVLLVSGVTACRAAPKTVLGLSLASKIPALSVNETRIVAASTDTPDHMEYIDRIPQDIWSEQQAELYPAPDEMVKATNAVLASFGYRLQQNPVMSSYSFQLYKGDELLQDGIASFHPITLKADGSDFALPVDLSTGTVNLVFFNGRSETWGSKGDYNMCRPPVYAGDMLVTACEDGETVAVFEGDELVFTTPAFMAVEDPLKDLNSWQGQWILEVEGKVFVSGQSLNEALGYAEIFNFTLIGGQPFFFFTRQEGGEVGVSYGLQEQAQTYDQVQHYLCCEPAGFNPRSTTDVIWFHALKDGYWYFVSMGVSQ
jgi:hypothetical protein